MRLYILSRFKLVVGLLVTNFIVNNSWANVSEKEAAKLGKELTPVGAIKQANATGTIPEWTGGSVALNNFKADKSGRPNNPYPSDQPLFVIKHENVKEYSDKLSPGQQALLKAYPDYSYPVYETRRTASLPQNIYDKAKKNAVLAKLSDDGNAVINFDEAIPFPIPQNGLEVIWNHITRYRGGSGVRNFTQIASQASGDFAQVNMRDVFVFPWYLKGKYNPKVDDNKLFYYKQLVTAPARLSGNVLLVHETIDQIKEPRQSWIYNSGQRRVRRAPQVAYDSPGTASDGLSTTDNFDLYNGAPDRYNWELIGKEEKYIPYNAYLLMDNKIKYKDIIQKGHMNSKYLRYELHRVWVVEATLKDDFKHVYAKRRFYVDEDSWQISVVDHYDNRGELWRISESHKVQFPQANAPWIAAEALYDLIARRYMVTGLSNEEKVAVQFGTNARRKDFTPAALRRSGRK